jgi:hypothetical protein
MATYPELAKQREVKAQRAAQDNFLRRQQHAFDLSARDNHMKYERPSFAVVTASDAFRTGYDAIRWDSDEQGSGVLEEGPSESSRAEE